MPHRQIQLGDDKSRPSAFVRLVIYCAWCGSVSTDRSSWLQIEEPDFLLHARERDTPLSHGICPSCFSKLAPDVPYPERA